MNFPSNPFHISMHSSRYRTAVRHLASSVFVIALITGSTGGDGSLRAQSNEATTNESPLGSLKAYLATSSENRKPIADIPGAKTPLTKQDIQTARQLILDARKAELRAERKAELDAKVIVDGELKMPFIYKTFGEKPEAGRSLYISMHGGGGAPKRVNDGQWENQKRLYTLDEGVYLVPRAPTDTWNLWHQDHIDRMFARLIEDMIVFEDVNPNRVYIMGYSAGGDGVFQLAPRMADQLAAAAMMAGHPNETVPLGLRNIGFTLHMGGKDSAYNRNELARQWKTKLAELHEQDPAGYNHLVVIHEDKGHWMDRQDAVALPWMAAFQRQTSPKKIVWKQDDVTHSRYYWLGVAKEHEKGGTLVEATLDSNVIRIDEKSDLHDLRLLLTDNEVDLDAPVKVFFGDKQIAEATIPRTIASLYQSLTERFDPDHAPYATMELHW